MSEEQLPQTTEENQEPKGPMSVFVMGDEKCPLTKATAAAFRVPLGATVEVASLSDIDRVVELKPGLVFITEEIRVKKNNTLDDADLINVVQKLVRMTDSGICIRSSLNIETTERLIMGISKPAFDAKIVYMPDTTGSSDLGQLISPSVQYMGGTQEAVQSFMGIVTNLSQFTAGMVHNGSVFDVVYANLAVSGFRIVKQKFFDELYDGVLDLKNANPMVVRRLVEKHPDLVDPSLCVPSFVTEKSFYDSTIFNGATDALTVLSTALGD